MIIYMTRYLVSRSKVGGEIRQFKRKKYKVLLIYKKFEREIKNFPPHNNFPVWFFACRT